MTKLALTSAAFILFWLAPQVAPSQDLAWMQRVVKQAHDDRLSGTDLPYYDGTRPANSKIALMLSAFDAYVGIIEDPYASIIDRHRVPLAQVMYSLAEDYEAVGIMGNACARHLLQFGHGGSAWQAAHVGFAQQFIDLPENHWAYQPLLEAYEFGLHENRSLFPRRRAIKFDLMITALEAYMVLKDRASTHRMPREYVEFTVQLQNLFSQFALDFRGINVKASVIIEDLERMKETFQKEPSGVIERDEVMLGSPAGVVLGVSAVRSGDDLIATAWIDNNTEKAVRVVPLVDPRIWIETAVREGLLYKSIPEPDEFGISVMPFWKDLSESDLVTLPSGNRLSVNLITRGILKGITSTVFVRGAIIQYIHKESGHPDGREIRMETPWVEVKG